MAGFGERAAGRTAREEDRERPVGGGVERVACEEVERVSD